MDGLAEHRPPTLQNVPERVQVLNVPGKTRHDDNQYAQAEAVPSYEPSSRTPKQFNLSRHKTGLDSSPFLREVVHRQTAYAYRGKYSSILWNVETAHQ